MQIKIEVNRGSLRWLFAFLIAVGLFFGGYFLHQSTGFSRPTQQTVDQKKNYYVSFDDYYYEVPKSKTANDQLIPGGQFLYGTGVAVRTNSLDSLFDDGAIAVQALIPLNGDNGAFERYVNEAVKPAAAAAFKGTADVTLGNRKRDNVRTAEVVAKKDGAPVRRQFIVNMAQSVNVISRDDSEAYRAVIDTLGQASAKFSDYEKIKQLVRAQSYMLSNRMFDDIYRLAHDDMRSATSVDALNRLADKSKDVFTLEASITGVNLSKDELTATIYYTDKNKPANNKIGVLQFHKAGGEWKLFALQLPNGTISGAAAN